MANLKNHTDNAGNLRGNSSKEDEGTFARTSRETLGDTRKKGLPLVLGTGRHSYSPPFVVRFLQVDEPILSIFCPFGWDPVSVRK